jgi:geranylgeranyl pyrophosphate synthase
MVDTVLKDGNYDRAPFAEILRLIRQRHGFDRVRERAQSFTERARAIMSEFPDSPNQRAMYALTELVTERDH